MLWTQQEEVHMDLGVTEIAGQLAETIPTGATTPEQAKADWRSTIYNAKATASVRPLTDMIKRSAPGDAKVAELCDELRKKRRS
jgi:hypothetical protein